MVASYSGLYEECDVEHINVPSLPTLAKTDRCWDDCRWLVAIRKLLTCKRPMMAGQARGFFMTLHATLFRELRMSTFKFKFITKY